MKQILSVIFFISLRLNLTSQENADQGKLLLEGVVKDHNEIRTLADIIIIQENDTLKTQTTQEGEFYLDFQEGYLFTFIIEKEGYHSKKLLIDTRNGGQKTYEVPSEFILFKGNIKDPEPFAIIKYDSKDDYYIPEVLNNEKKK